MSRDFRIESINVSPFFAISASPCVYESEPLQLIHEKSSRFIMMPGGLGTFDEFFETWCQVKIGVIKKQIGFVNIDGYFDTLFQFINECNDHGFVSESNIKIPKCYQTVLSCLDDLVMVNKFAITQDELID